MTAPATFDALRDEVLSSLPAQRCAVAGAADEHALQAVFEAARQGFVSPVLVGRKDEVLAQAERCDTGVDYEIVDCSESCSPSEVAVELVRSGRADFILKGHMQTADLLRPILNKQTGLNDSGFVTHFGLAQIAGFPKMIALSDSTVIPHPTLEQKARIISICADTLRKLGVERPVVAALCATEVVSDKMPETLDAQALSRTGEEGRFGDAIVLGPISYDLATSEEAAQMKGYSSPYGGKVDMLLVPDIVVGNVLSKVWNSDPRNKLAGCLVGARVPIGLTSRSASADEKLNSLLLCSVLSARRDGR